MRLTEDGERLLDLAAPLVEGFDSLKKMFLDQHGKAERHLRVAAPATVLNSYLPPVIARYRLSHPQVRLSLIDAPSRLAWQLLEDDEADIAFVGTPDGVKLSPRLMAHPLARHPFQAVCPVGHPFAQITAPKLRDIVKQPLILAGQNSSSRMQFDSRVAKAGLSDKVNIIMTAGNLATILNYVTLGLGVAILTLPASASLLGLPDGKPRVIYRDVSGCLGHDQVTLLHRKGRYEPAHLKAFHELAVRSVKTPS